MKRIIPVAIFSALAIAACGGGGGSSTDGSDPDADPVVGVTGLKMPSSMSVVAAKSQLSGPSSKISAGIVSAKSSQQISQAISDADSDYVMDEAHTYVYDASMESLDTVNMILCLMEQTGASEMVNEGAYIALVNEDKCEQGENKSNSGSTGQSSGGQVDELSAWTIESTRASSTADQLVKIWVPGDTGGDPMDEQEILVEVTVTDAVSSTLPFGNFTMNFKGVAEDSGNEFETMRGLLQTVDNDQGQPQFRFVNLGGDAIDGGSVFGFSFEEAASVVLDDADGTGGVAKTRRAESNPYETIEALFAVAFDTDYLLRGKDDDGVSGIDATSCKSRNSFNSQVWRYNLYHAVDGTFNGEAVSGGDRVELNSGFPFNYDNNNDGSNDAYGYVGYHGVWTENGVLDDGASITRFDYSSDTTSELTVNVSPGKMVRRSANTESLTSFQGDEFQYWGPHPVYTSFFGQWLVTVDGNNDFQIISTFSWGNNGPVTSTTFDHDGDQGASTAEVAAAATISLTNNQNIWLWSDSLGGNIAYIHNDSQASGERTVTFYAEEFVSPADSTLFPGSTGSVTLYCYERCLKGGLDQAAIDAATNENDLYYAYAGTPFEYSLSSSSGKVILRDHLNNIVSAVGLDFSLNGNLHNDWGINTGEMVATALADPAQPWGVYGASVSYRWETGDNDWNRLVTVTDVAGNVANFDRPLQFTYTHTTANDANDSADFNNKKFMLQYGGSGELWGFPWVEDVETGRWYAAATLKDGVTLSDGSNNFVVKAIEQEQTMQDIDESSCSSLNIDNVLTDPALVLPSISDMGTVSFSLSDKPVVTAAPAVIEGELQ
ncbi:MAG: hypothetical protein OQL09_08180 [Gammaproteobacteria bacterium]|nr:hypothetical protein [Gammaproteobacteria bacterium]